MASMKQTLCLFLWRKPQGPSGWWTISLSSEIIRFLSIRKRREMWWVCPFSRYIPPYGQRNAYPHAHTRAALTLAPERQPATFLRRFSISPRWAGGDESLLGAALQRTCDACSLSSSLQEF